MPIFRVKSVKIYTGQKKIYTGAARGARNKYEVCASHIFLLPVTHSSEEWNIETAMLSTPCLCCPFSHISSASGSVSNCSQCWIVSCLWLSLIILFLWSFIVFWFSSKVIFGKKGKRTPIKMRFLISLQVVLLSRQFISLQANNASQSGDPISKPLTNQNHHDWWLIYAFGSYSSQSAMSQAWLQSEALAWLMLRLVVVHIC